MRKAKVCVPHEGNEQNEAELQMGERGQVLQPTTCMCFTTHATKPAMSVTTLIPKRSRSLEGQTKSVTKATNTRLSQSEHGCRRMDGRGVYSAHLLNPRVEWGEGHPLRFLQKFKNFRNFGWCVFVHRQVRTSMGRWLVSHSNSFTPLKHLLQGVLHSVF